MNGQENDRKKLVMDKEIPNEELESTNANNNTSQDTQNENLDLCSTSPSPTCTENYLGTSSTLNVSIPEELSDFESKKMKAKSEGLIRSCKYKSKFLDTSSEKAESIYNLRKSVRNPITGEVTKLSVAIPESSESTVSETENSSRVASSIRQRKTPKSVKIGDVHCNIKFLDDVKPQLQVRRNPITGDGIEDVYFPTNVKNFKRSGIRITQPPGGLSTGIF